MVGALLHFGFEMVSHELRTLVRSEVRDVVSELKLQGGLIAEVALMRDRIQRIEDQIGFHDVPGERSSLAFQMKPATSLRRRLELLEHYAGFHDVASERSYLVSPSLTSDEHAHISAPGNEVRDVWVASHVGLSDDVWKHPLEGEDSRKPETIVAYHVARIAHFPTWCNPSVWFLGLYLLMEIVMMVSFSDSILVMDVIHLMKKSADGKDDLETRMVACFYDAEKDAQQILYPFPSKDLLGTPWPLGVLACMCGIIIAVQVAQNDGEKLDTVFPRLRENRTLRWYLNFMWVLNVAFVPAVFIYSVASLLASSYQAEDLILNSVQASFLLDVDNLFFQGLLSRGAKQHYHSQPGIAHLHQKPWKWRALSFVTYFSIGTLYLKSSYDKRLLQEVKESVTSPLEHYDRNITGLCGFFALYSLRGVIFSWTEGHVCARICAHALGFGIGGVSFYCYVVHAWVGPSFSDKAFGCAFSNLS